MTTNDKRNNCSTPDVPHTNTFYYITIVLIYALLLVCIFRGVLMNLWTNYRVDT